MANVEVELTNDEYEKLLSVDKKITVMDTTYDNQDVAVNLYLIFVSRQFKNIVDAEFKFEKYSDANIYNRKSVMGKSIFNASIKKLLSSLNNNECDL
jgi:hypothetical protein